MPHFSSFGIAVDGYAGVLGRPQFLEEEKRAGEQGSGKGHQYARNA